MMLIWCKCFSIDISLVYLVPCIAAILFLSASADTVRINVGGVGISSTSTSFLSFESWRAILIFDVDILVGDGDVSIHNHVDVSFLMNVIDLMHHI